MNMFNVNCHFNKNGKCECPQHKDATADCFVTSQSDECDFMIPNERQNLTSLQSGIELISMERTRQIEAEGWTPEHDDEHTDGSLAMAAACYAARKQLFVKQWGNVITESFVDPWPRSWANRWDKRCFSYPDNKNYPLPGNPEKYSNELRLDLLVKAGALIAAEIDRLNRAASKAGES